MVQKTVTQSLLEANILSYGSLGIIGGTFSPPHNVHMLLATFAYSQYCLDKILMFPSSVPTLGKKELPVANHHRFNMTYLAAKEVPYIEVFDWELSSKIPVYTIQTLRRLKKIYSKTKLLFIAGSDIISTIESWREPCEVVKLVDIILSERLGVPIEQAVQSLKKIGCNDDKIHLLDFPRIDVSSTMIRNRLRKNQDCTYLLPKAVLQYIKTNKLYTED